MNVADPRNWAGTLDPDFGSRFQPHWRGGPPGARQAVEPFGLVGGDPGRGRRRGAGLTRGGTVNLSQPNWPM